MLEEENFRDSTHGCQKPMSRLCDPLQTVNVSIVRALTNNWGSSVWPRRLQTEATKPALLGAVATGVFAAADDTGVVTVPSAFEVVVAPKPH
jgi:hypothetical protein